jgi:hypothetical protein
MYSSVQNFQAVVLKQRLSGDDGRSSERERSNTSGSRGSDWCYPRCFSVSSEHVEDYLEPASDALQQNRASQRGLADPVDTCSKFPRHDLPVTV